MLTGLTEGDAAGADPLRGEHPSRHCFERLAALADAVLYEGYLLYPYRRSSTKNRVRWQFGVLFPRDWVEASGPLVPGVSGSADSWYQRTECLLRVRRPGAVVRVKVRYLQMQHKQVEEPVPDGGYRPVASLRTESGAAYLTFDEAVPRETEVAVRLDDLLQRERTVPVGAAAGTDTEPLPEGVGRVVRRREEVRAHTTLVAEHVFDDICRIRVRTAHTGSAPGLRLPRDEALRGALIATHTLLDGDGVQFVSMIDPPAPLVEAARACRNEFTFPVLGGEPPEDGADTGGTAPLLLSAPIILPDHPQVAPESPGDLHDAAEIDEILSLRTMLLTDEEKREARATDPRAAAIIDRVDSMPQEVFARLHGAVRSLKPADPAADQRPVWWREDADAELSPVTDTVLVDGVPVSAGSQVRLRPKGRGADAQDMFLVGRTAQVAAVLHDVDGSTHLAVTLDDDPAAELHSWYGRFHYFRPDELQPLTSADAAAPGAARTDSPTDSERRPMT
ncbi:hypothetical protein Stsp02_30010 [Streptomyces sp. NBRC 14336]|uniref:hypothetical protein n=1 Tax=Streptomyces sp. NBRC 14336 TaxID=3030992 RepID=UPI0024A2922F|nr:hypothetical protein [Streptomyces sp. NBRC 14336]WBO82109.1 hypothetical protein SBE_006009 [Streptomyces sp. SBE_14.2]GLW47339.1 hypothetical protein Stsp02_30010 [Streptomyces sp. NBRC 14336]